MGIAYRTLQQTASCYRVGRCIAAADRLLSFSILWPLSGPPWNDRQAAVIQPRDRNSRSRPADARPLLTAHGDFRILCFDRADRGRNVYPVSIYGGRAISC